MKHDCPHCRTSLKWKLVRSKPLPGERKFLPNKAVAVCPQCGGQLASNIHWSEGVAGPVVGLPLLCFFAFRPAMLKHVALWWFAAVTVLWILVFSFLHLRYWRHWERYKPYEPTRR